ncbi:helix-turn-helix domain-containing protein [Erythrobacter sp. F6033]|uniref:helix-turn-helix domain-containing protein n=1 Tax=Erythrobacter sp. F6033 TaxID=2926401 RepID=UPI001FF52D72|nr:helix-turn-helix domain-containing protein [Erythrobacter sp. F6033]MCK0129195.1 helix-turn-helix domain-containing protein [Erythrobacter sp. F6033]
MDSEQDNSSEELTEEPVAEARTAGDRLRTAREEKGLELSHVAAETRIPLRHLETIENSTFDKLPSRTYAIGFARSYARVVGLNESEIADAVREDLAGGYSRQSALAGGMEPGDPGKLPSAGLAWFGALAALILAVGIYFFYSTYFGAGDGLEPLIAEGSADDSQTGEALSGENAAEQSAAASAPDASGQVVFTAMDELWVRFYDADYEQTREPIFEGLMSAGDSFDLPANVAEPRINTGRPDALVITIGGREVPKLAEEPIAIGDEPISATALLARADPTESAVN